MKILIVASYNSGRFSPFVVEQATSLSKIGVIIDFFGIKGKGAIGYILCRKLLKKKINEFAPDLIHAHYGLSGLLANMQRRIPVCTTYHGTDIHSGGLLLLLSRICMKLSVYNIFVGERLLDMASYKSGNCIVQSCGLEMQVIKPIEQYIAREKMGLQQTKQYILFAGSFDNTVKNYELARKSVEQVGGCSLIELKGYSKKEVSLLMNACDVLLVTSHKESGPLVVKEAMACGRPIVTTNVGDVEWIVGQTNGCYITSYEVDDCAAKIKLALTFSKQYKSTTGRSRIENLGLNNNDVAKRIYAVYKEILNR